MTKIQALLKSSDYYRPEVRAGRNPDVIPQENKILLGWAEDVCSTLQGHE